MANRHKRAQQTANLREQAQRRVDSDQRLKQHEATIMYDWREGDEHWTWVITASVQEIVDWAETVEKD